MNRNKWEAILVTEKTIPIITSRCPLAFDHFDRHEIAELIADKHYFVTYPENNWLFAFILEETLLENYGTHSPAIKERFVPVVQVLN